MDVGGWLRGLGLGQYEEQFRDNKIDADLLPRLTVDDLKDIGVSVVGDRRRLLDAIAVITGAGPASPTKSAPSKGLQASAERRPITVMFCDLVGSTSLAAKLDAEDWRNLVNAYLDEASAAVTDLGGHVLKKLGDGLMALFGYPPGTGERCRARGSRCSRHPTRTRRPQRKEYPIGRARAFRPHRHRVRLCRGRRSGRGVR
jgi:class 3 adenylate cyclase